MATYLETSNIIWDDSDLEKSAGLSTTVKCDDVFWLYMFNQELHCSNIFFLGILLNFLLSPILLKLRFVYVPLQKKYILHLVNSSNFLNLVPDVFLESQFVIPSNKKKKADGIKKKPIK